MHSREPGSYILRVIGCGRFDFLLQVRDEERLLYWYSLFDNNRQPPSSNHWSANINDDGGVMMPLGNLSMNNLSLMNTVSLAPPSPSHQGGQQLAPSVNPRSESDQTLHGDMSLTTHHGNSSNNSTGGVEESMGFSQVSSNYFNSMLNSHQLCPPQHHQYQQYQEHSQASTTSLGGQGGRSELIERSGNVPEHQRQQQQQYQRGGGEGSSPQSQSLRGQQSVVDLGTLSRVVVGESDGAMRRSGREQQQQQQQQHGRQYV
jgi:hypothetical protein